MGEINKACDTIYGIHLQSYTLIVVNIVVFQLFKYCFEQFFFPWLIARFSCLARYRSDLELIDWDANTATEGMENPINLYSSSSASSTHSNTASTAKAAVTAIAQAIPASLRTPQLAFFYFQAISAVVSFLVIAAKVDASMAKWSRYQQFYGIVFNSSIFTFFISSIVFYAKTVNGNATCNDDRQSVVEAFDKTNGRALTCTLIILLFFLPPIITHILPAIIVYFWLMIIFLLAGLGCWFLSIVVGACVDGIGKEKLQQSEILAFLVVEMCFRLIMILLFQTFYNYMFLFYNVHVHGVIGQHDYFNIMNEEYSFRTQTYCSFERGLSSIENALVLFNWL